MSKSSDDLGPERTLAEMDTLIFEESLRRRARLAESGVLTEAQQKTFDDLGELVKLTALPKQS